MVKLIKDLLESIKQLNKNITSLNESISNMNNYKGIAGVQTRSKIED